MTRAKLEMIQERLSKMQAELSAIKADLDEWFEENADYINAGQAMLFDPHESEDEKPRRAGVVAGATARRRPQS